MFEMKTLLILLLLACLAACSETDEPYTNDLTRNSPNTNRSLPSGSMHLAPATVIDPGGFGRPMVASSILAPVGWSASGGVVWMQNTPPCGEHNPHTSWKAVSPDGMQAVEILAEEVWNGDNFPIPPEARGGCPNVQVNDARSFVVDYALRHRPGARVLDYRDLPANELREVQNFIDQNSGPQAMGENRNIFAGGKVLIAYTLNGVDMRESIHVSFIVAPLVMPGGMGGQMQRAATIATLMGFAVRAPAGSLNLKFADVFARSIKANPAYAQLMADHNARINGIVNRGVSERIGISIRTNDEIHKIQNDYWDRKNASDNRGQNEIISGIRDANEYADPYTVGGVIELDNSFQNAWRLSDGTYVLTDDTSFNPALATGLDGQQLRRTR